MRLELGHGVVFEGTPEEIRKAAELMGVKFSDGETGVAKEPERLQVGDYARVVKDCDGVFAPNEIVEITDVRCFRESIPYLAESLDGGKCNLMLESEVVKAADEEVAEARRTVEEAKRVEKWAEIGREPNEYKVGDLVRVIDGSGSSLSVEDIGSITEIDFDMARVTVPNRENTRNWRMLYRIELVAPVESRFDQ